MRTNLSLVLEGGGMRGAYTAGCIEWLIDNNIEFENIYAISAGAVYATTFVMKDKMINHELSCRIIPGKDVVGLKAFLIEGRIVAYRHGFYDILVKKYGYSLDKFNNSDQKTHIGFYDLKLGKTIYLDNKDITIDHLIAACSLPIISSVSKLPQGDFLDGGITEMIPIDKSIKDGNTKHLCIATKPVGYERKPGKSFVINIMKLFFKKRCPQIPEDYKVRHLNYKDQMDKIAELEKSGDAILIRPQRERKVSRLGGKPEVLDELYLDGYKDMEANKEAIFKLINK